MRHLVLLGLLVLVVCAGCHDPYELKEKLIVQKWPLAVWEGKYKVFREDKKVPEGEVAKMRPIATGDPEESRIVFDEFVEVLKTSLPEAKIKTIKGHRGLWKGLNRHIIAEVWPVAEYHAVTGPHKFKLILRFYLKFWKVENGAVTEMEVRYDQLSRVESEVFDADMDAPHKDHLYACRSPDDIMENLMHKVAKDAQEWLDEVRASKKEK